MLFICLFKREENQRRMYESMIEALKPSTSEGYKLPKELEIIDNIHKKELADTKQRQDCIIEQLQNQNEEYKHSIIELEAKINNLLIKNAENEKLCQIKAEEMEKMRKYYEEKHQIFERENSDYKEKATLNAGIKVANLNTILEKTKSEHKHELEKMKKECESTVNELKYIYEKDKLLAKSRLEKAYFEIKILQNQKSNCDSGRNFIGLQNNSVEQTRELDGLKNKHEEDTNIYMQPRDEEIKNVKDVEQNTPKVKNGQYLTNKEVQSNASERVEQRNAKHKTAPLKNYVYKLQNSKKLIKTMLEEQSGICHPKDQIDKEPKRRMTLINFERNEKNIEISNGELKQLKE